MPILSTLGGASARGFGLMRKAGPLALTFVDMASGSGSATLGASQAGDLIIGLSLAAGSMAGATSLGTLVAGYSGLFFSLISGAGATITGTYGVFLFRYRPSKVITTVLAGPAVDLPGAGSSVPAFSSGGQNLVVGIGQEQSAPAYINFTGLSNAIPSAATIGYAAAQCAVNPNPVTATPFTIATGSLYSAYSGFAQINVK